MSVLAATNRPDQLDHLVDQVAQQTGVERQLLLITHGALPHGLVDRHLWLRDGRLSEAAPAAGR